MKLSECKRIYFLGIGGIGMSALARYFNDVGMDVQGYDLVNSALTQQLAREGIIINYSDEIAVIPEDIDLVVLTPAIHEDNNQYSWLRSKNIPIKKRAEVLGMLSRERKAIAIAGTHGKTTTSCLLAHMLTQSGLEISAFLGGLLAEGKTNYVKGSSDFVVLEADEYDRSFLHLSPQILVIISMDADHLDIYGDVEQMYLAYRQLTDQIVEGGILILGPGVYDLMSDEWISDLNTSGIAIHRIHSDFDYKSVVVKDNRFQFKFKTDTQKQIVSVDSNLPGLHNVINTTLALEVGVALRVSLSDLIRSISSFKGVLRRFETVYNKGRVLVDDYAHHPEEVSYAVKTIKQLYPNDKVLGIFQPHLYSRTSDFYKDFAKELSGLDGVLLMPIYPAREVPMDGVESELIYNLITLDDKELINSDSLIAAIKIRSDYKVVMTIGAADLEKYHKEIIKVI